MTIPSVTSFQDVIITCYATGSTQHLRLYYRQALFIIFGSRQHSEPQSATGRTMLRQIWDLKCSLTQRLQRTSVVERHFI